MERGPLDTDETDARLVIVVVAAVVVEASLLTTATVADVDDEAVASEEADEEDRAAADSVRVLCWATDTLAVGDSTDGLLLLPLLLELSGCAAAGTSAAAAVGTVAADSAAADSAAGDCADEDGGEPRKAAEGEAAAEDEEGEEGKAGVGEGDVDAEELEESESLPLLLLALASPFAAPSTAAAGDLRCGDRFEIISSHNRVSSANFSSGARGGGGTDTASGADEEGCG